MKIISKTILIVLFLILISNKTFGSELGLKKNFEIIGKDDTFEIFLILNTKEEIINAFEAAINYSDNMELEGVSDGNSIINLWVVKPTAENSKNGAILLSGLIPGGVKIKEGIILAFTFRNLSEGRGNVFVRDAKIFHNDPEASESEVNFKNLEFNIESVKTKTQTGEKLILDFLPPDKFRIYLSKNRNVFDNFWFISFNAQDKGSGIDYYEAREKFLGIFGDWRRAESPHQLKHQSLFSIIQVKAIDKVGRETTADFIPERFFTAGGILLLLVALAGLRINAAWRKNYYQGEKAKTKN